MFSRIHIPTARRAGEPYEWPEVYYIARQRFTPPYRFHRSIFYNPFTVARHGRERSVALYREMILGSEELLRELAALPEGTVFGCWCRLDELCHGGVLIELRKKMAKGWRWSDSG